MSQDGKTPPDANSEGGSELKVRILGRLGKQHVFGTRGSMVGKDSSASRVTGQVLLFMRQLQPCLMGMDKSMGFRLAD